MRKIYQDKTDVLNELNQYDDKKNYSIEFINALKSIGKILITVRNNIKLFNNLFAYFQNKTPFKYT